MLVRTCGYMCVRVSHEVRPLRATVGCDALKSTFDHCKNLQFRAKTVRIWSYRPTKSKPDARPPHGILIMCPEYIERVEAAAESGGMLLKTKRRNLVV